MKREAVNIANEDEAGETSSPGGVSAAVSERTRGMKA